jgi:thioredoxin-like negative regulator of GroEL
MSLEELESVRHIRTEWVKKRNALRLEEAKLSDINQLHTIVTKIEEINEKIISLDSEIITLESNLNSIKAIVDTVTKSNSESKQLISENDISRAIEVLKQETKELNFKSTKEDIAKIHDLKTKIFDEIFKDTDDQLNFVTSKKELMYSSVLFDKIYSSEILDSITIVEIEKIREDNDSYKWYDRSLIVTALSLSIINFKFESKKANLLLDFITDFELNVWERALTGLTIAIIYQKNRSWQRDNNFLNRLTTLKNNDEIQKGLELINFILMNKLYEDNLFNPNIFKIELFQNPMNCFVPFYDDNEILKQAINDAENDFDLDEFINYIDKLPFMDSHKYTLCLGLSTGGLQKSKLEGETAQKFLNSLNIANSFKPFQNLISEYYCFFNYFPKKLKDDVFKGQLLLTNTDLKKYILNKVMQLFLEANTLYNEEKFNEAINKYEDLLKIDKHHKEAYWQLGNCFIKKRENQKALNLFLDLEKQATDKPENDLLYVIADCYNVLKNYEKSNEYCNRIELEADDTNYKVLLLKAENFQELDDKPNAYLYCKKAEEKVSNENDMYNICIIYNLIEEKTDALRVIKKILETKKDVANYWRKLGELYCDELEWDLSIDALLKANELDNKNSHIRLSLGRSYLLSKTNLEEAKQLLEGLLSSKNECVGVSLGNLGHFYLLQGNNDKAFEYYLKCIQELNDDENFDKRMKLDAKFIDRFGVTLDKYNSLKDRVIKEFNLLKKS